MKITKTGKVIVASIYIICVILTNYVLAEFVYYICPKSSVSFFPDWWTFIPLNLLNLMVGLTVFTLLNYCKSCPALEKKPALKQAYFLGKKYKDYKQYKYGYRKKGVYKYSSQRAYQ